MISFEGQDEIILNVGSYLISHVVTPVKLQVIQSHMHRFRPTTTTCWVKFVSEFTKFEDSHVYGSWFGLL